MLRSFPPTSTRTRASNIYYHFVGKDAHLNQQAFNNLQLPAHAETAKHLGSMYHFTGTNTTEIEA
eukprot:2187220-Heterocapsa_arctica.AAC.1